MTVDPQTIRAEPHSEVGDLLQRDSRLLIERWSQRAALEQPHARRLHAAALQDDLPDLLEDIGRSLASSGDEQTNGHTRTASRHGAQRWEVGWSLPEVIRDYQILRLVVVEHLEQQLTRPLQTREVMAIGLALDEAITASASRYASQREEQIRNLERRRAEEVIQAEAATHQEQTDQLREVNRRKDEFLAILGHELRNPLAPIRNALYVLRERGGDFTTVQWACGMLERQAQHMARLIDDLLDVSRLGRGKVLLRREHLDLVQLVRNTAEDQRPTLTAAGLTLDLELPPSPVPVDGDPTRLAQVVGNLLHNAVKFTDTGGTISISVRPEAERVTVAVRDTGTGIEPDLLARVFEVFMQAERSLHRSRGGLGLGLALVKGLVELHGGGVRAESAGPGHGSTFTFWLPLAPTPSPV